MNLPKYSVAIRTLGTAGEKFEREIATLLTQAHLPESIFAYIPEGYEIPQFEGCENIKWIRCAKGMVVQRALPFSEITTPYVLFLDDDIELSHDTVKKLFDPIVYDNADVVVANIFPNHEGTVRWKFKAALGGTLPSLSRKWAFRVRKSTHYSYCNSPEDYMPTQSGAGGCILCNLAAYRNICFDEERWLEVCGYPLGEDLVFVNKFYRCGYRVIAHLKSGIVHLDAGAGKGKDAKKEFFNSQLLQYLIWRRISYDISSGILSKAYNAACFYGSLAFQSLIDIPRLFGAGRFMLLTRYKGILQGIKLRKSGIYGNIPAFDAHRRQS